MPTYDYRCQGCGHEFELFQSMSATVKRKCPECSELKLKRLIGTGGAVIFKGSGFFQTDYRSDSYKKAAEADKKTQDKKTGDKKTGDKKTEKKSDKNAGKPDKPATETSKSQDKDKGKK